MLCHQLSQLSLRTQQLYWLSFQLAHHSIALPRIHDACFTPSHNHQLHFQPSFLRCPIAPAATRCVRVARTARQRWTRSATRWKPWTCRYCACLRCIAFAYAAFFAQLHVEEAPGGEEGLVGGDGNEGDLAGRARGQAVGGLAAQRVGGETDPEEPSSDESTPERVAPQARARPKAKRGRRFGGCSCSGKTGCLKVR